MGILRRALAASAIGAACLAFSVYAGAQSNAASLSGRVSSPDGALEGVLVSAKRAGSTITVTVVSDKDGRYAFPSAKLPAGDYSISIRAVGYDLDGSDKAGVPAQGGATRDLTLARTKDLAAQLTNAEWIYSAPGTEAQKAVLLGCVGCHTLERPIYSTHTADEFVDVLRRMASYAQVSQPSRPQKKLYAPEANAPVERFKPQADWLASINLSQGAEWKYPLKTFPRPSGRGTRVVITEYDLPNELIQPHDVIVDRDGIAWYSDFGQMFLGALDPKTGKVAEFPIPLQKPHAPQGSLALRDDAQGNLWLGMMFQGGVARFDKVAKNFQIFPLPADRNDDGTQVNMVAPQRSTVDGKVWVQDTGKLEAAHRLDLVSGKFETFEPFKNAGPDAPFPPGVRHVLYDVIPDSKNNAYFTDLTNQVIGRIDAATGQARFWRTPTANSNTRRGSMDAKDRFWFAEHRGNRIGMFDPASERVREWEAPVPWSAPYDVAVDRNGEAWTGGMTADRVLRLDPKTGDFVAYLLPRETNIRRVFVDNSAERPTFWVGSNHGASIIKLEPLD